VCNVDALYLCAVSLTPWSRVCDYLQSSHQQSRNQRDKKPLHHWDLCIECYTSKWCLHSRTATHHDLHLIQSYRFNIQCNSHDRARMARLTDSRGKCDNSSRNRNTRGATLYVRFSCLSSRYYSDSQRHASSID